MSKVVPLMPKLRPEAGDLLTAAAVAKRWHCCVDTVHRKTFEQLPWTRPGKLKLFRLDDVLAHEEQRRGG